MHGGEGCGYFRKHVLFIHLGPGIISDSHLCHSPQHRYYTPRLTKAALDADFRQPNYHQCWQGFKSAFTGPDTSEE